ncbi:MAG TPA: ATP-binding protein, partial [Caldilineaceae bacterium]|nr:ATP-binding protein [Caldilineaceae bacterium]
ELHNQINRSLMSSVNMREILQAIVDGVGQVVGARFVFLHMVKEQTGKLRSAIFGAGQEGSAGGQLDPNQHWPRLVELVLQDRRPIHVRRTAQRSDTGQRSPLGDSHFAIPVWNPLTDHPQGKDFGAVVAVPLIHQGKALGVLTAVNLVSDPPLTEREMELMLVIANQATVAIENAGMFQEAEQRAADLSRSNAELTQFAYVVSRDLQTPLHTLQGYAQLLAHRQAGQDRDADDFLRNILAGVEEMNGLIGDLLTFSRLDTGEMSFAIVHSEQILERTLTSLQAIIQDSQATITHDPMPLLSVDPIQFEQLLYTLISNSLQFPDIHPPRIHIGVRVEKSEYQFSITDNGVGISPEYQEQLSLPSHRIRSRPNARGAGVGLAISKKIVEAHGGRIWYESRPGKGTTFYFALPIG